MCLYIFLRERERQRGIVPVSVPENGSDASLSCLGSCENGSCGSNVQFAFSSCAILIFIVWESISSLHSTSTAQESLAGMSYFV